jgi:hypothetical protein
MSINISKYKSVGEFYEDMKKQGYFVPLCMCACLSKLMQQRRLSFQEAYNFLWGRKSIFLVGKFYIYDLTADKLWR